MVAEGLLIFPSGSLIIMQEFPSGLSTQDKILDHKP